MPDMPPAFNHLPRAIYVPSQLQEFAGNPLVEALPPYRLAKEIDQALGQIPPFSPCEREHSDGLRTLQVVRLRNWLEAMPHHEKVIDLIGALVRSGYRGRNPSDPDGHKHRVAFYRQLMTDGFMMPLNASHPSTAPAHALFGTSGVGKTSVVEFCLRALLPQVIYHAEGGFAQIVWLKLDCPPDGSIKQFLMAVLENIDRLLLTGYKAQMRGAVVDALILFVGKLCVMHNVGIIVIDEIQNLLVSKNAPRRKLLNFFTNISNEARVPILTMGTVAAMGILSTTLQQARRSGDMGSIIWDRMREDDDWELFISGMQKYQWVRKPVKLEGELSGTLYNETMGIPALVVRLFQLAQIEAIADRSETVTVDLLTRVAAQRFGLLRPMLAALRAGKDVGQWEDLFRVTVDGLDGRLDDVANPLKKHRRVSTAREKAMAVLRTLFGRKEAMRAVDDLLASEPDLGEDAIIDRVRMAIEGDDPVMAALPPPLDEDLASVHPDGGALQEAIHKQKQRRGTKKRKVEA